MIVLCAAVVILVHFFEGVCSFSQGLSVSL